MPRNVEKMRLPLDEEANEKRPVSPYLMRRLRSLDESHMTHAR